MSKLSSLKGLKDACGSECTRVLTENIQTGSTSWFWGQPAKSEDGFVELNQEDGAVLVVKEADILQVIDSGAGFAIEVADSATMGLRQEIVFTAGDESGFENDDDEEVVPYGFNISNWLPEYDDSILGAGGNAFKPSSCTTLPYYKVKKVKTVGPNGEVIVVKVPTIGFKKVCGVDPYPPSWVKNF